uniref:Band 7 domain-containing protein n=1 Tax=Attheya septentrionalis TaxID=420275 RepID=A0A7S2UGS3_9STRA|mmetsp:Transcript_21927/g.39567  ORF Transcript_21927/g.39567 Transcript_21927/m.39567 type:complete len:596 (+) Transcript_21927:91-1878(+)
MSYANPTETLTSNDIRSVGAANEEFGSDTSLIVARPGGGLCCSFPLFWFTVPEGFYALVARHGKQEKYSESTYVWPPGLHVGSPWLRVSHLVTKQIMVFNTPVRGCKTKDNVTVQIDVCVTLRVMGGDHEGDDPENVYKFVHMVTAMGLQQQLTDAQAEAVRTLARSVTHTEVFGLRSVSPEELVGAQGPLFSAGGAPLTEIMELANEGGPNFGRQDSELTDKFGEEKRDLEGEHDAMDPIEAGFNTETGASVTDAMRDRLNRQFKPQGVEILDVIIQQITLPEEIEKQMSQKTMVISQNAEQRMQQKYDMLNLSQMEGIKTLKQSQSEAKMELLKDGEFDALQEKLKLQESMARGERSWREIDMQMHVDVDMINAESSLKVQRIQDETTLVVQKIKETSEANADIVRVNAFAEVEEIDAKAELSVAKHQAQADKALFKAEGASAVMNRTLNEHMTSLHRLDAQSALALNDKLIVTGTEGGDAANQFILADAALRDIKKRDPSSEQERSVILSELAVASGQAQIRLNVWDNHPAATTPTQEEKVENHTPRVWPVTRPTPVTEPTPKPEPRQYAASSRPPPPKTTTTRQKHRQSAY